MKHTLNFNPAYNTANTNNEAAKAMRDMTIAATNLKKALDSGNIDADDYFWRMSAMLETHIRSFQPLDGRGQAIA